MEKRSNENLTNFTDEEKKERLRIQKRDCQRRYQARKKAESFGIDNYPKLRIDRTQTPEEKQKRKNELDRSYRKHDTLEQHEEYLKKERERKKKIRDQIYSENSKCNNLQLFKKLIRRNNETEEQFLVRFKEHNSLKREYRAEYNKLYNQVNTENIKLLRKEWEAKNPEYKKMYNKKYYEITAEQQKLNKKEWYRANAEKAKADKKEYRERIKNDPVLLEEKRTRDRERHHKIKLENVQYVLVKTLRASLRNRIDKTRKRDSVLALIGCTIEEFIKHVENQFEPGMTWTPKNFHLDHIKPCSSFDLTDPEQIKKCFHYNNYQPLWPIDNLKKSDRLDWERTQERQIH